MKLYQSNGYDLLFNVLICNISKDGISDTLIILIRLFNDNRYPFRCSLNNDIYLKLLSYMREDNPLIQCYSCYIVANLCSLDSI